MQIYIITEYTNRNNTKEEDKLCANMRHYCLFQDKFYDILNYKNSKNEYEELQRHFIDQCKKRLFYLYPDSEPAGFAFRTYPKKNMLKGKITQKIRQLEALRHKILVEGLINNADKITKENLPYIKFQIFDAYRKGNKYI